MGDEVIVVCFCVGVGGEVGELSIVFKQLFFKVMCNKGVE